MTRRFTWILTLILLATMVSAVPDTSLLHYTSSQLNTSRFRTYGLTLSAEQSFTENQGNVNWIEAASSPKRQEHIQVELRSDGTLVAHVYRQSLFASKTLTTSFGTIAAQFKGFDVSYTQDGQAIIVYANDTIDPVYEIWNGTNFNGGGKLIVNDSCRGIPRWIQTASDPNSNQLIMVELDTTASHCAQVWDGTSWGDTNFFVDTDLSSSVAPRIDIAFEQNNSNALVVFESDALGAPRYATWTGSWSGTASVPGLTTDLIKWVRLAPRKNSNHIALTVYQNSNTSAIAGVWSGSSWNTFAAIDSSIEPNAQRPIDLSYKGTSDELNLVYYDNDTGTPVLATCSGNNCLTGTFATSALPPLPQITFLQLHSNYLTDNLLLGAVTELAHEKYLSKYTSLWSLYTLLGNNTNRNAAEDMMFALDNFNDTIPPEVSSITPAQGSNQSSFLPVTIQVNVDDFGVVDTVYVNLTNPSGTTNTFQMNYSGGNTYSITIQPASMDIYNIRILANDSVGNMNDTQTSWFNYTNVGPLVNITEPSPNSGFSDGSYILLAGNASRFPNITLTGNALSWYSSIDGFLGNGINLTVNLSTGIHTITLRAADSYNKSNNASILVQFFPDRDFDGLADTPDNLEGDESWVTTTGVDELDVLANNNTNISNRAYTGLANVSFKDGNISLLDFTHNFSLSELDLSTIRLNVGFRVFILNTTDEYLINDSKTIYLTDYNYTNLCAKSTMIDSDSQMTDDCTGANETDLTNCLGSINATTIGGYICQDLGDTLVISNLTTIAIEGQTPQEAPIYYGRNGGGPNRYNPASRYTPAKSPPPSAPNSPNRPAPPPAPKTATQNVVPKAPEAQPEAPEPIKEVKASSRWWLWILAILGVLLLVISFARSKPLKEENQRRNNFMHFRS